MPDGHVLSSGQGTQFLLDRLRRLGDLSGDDAQALLDLPCTVRSMRHGAVVVKQGETQRHCTLMLSGIATRDRLSGTGTRQFSGFYLRGDLVDVDIALVGCGHDTIQVFGEPLVAQIPSDRLLALAAARPAIGRLLWVSTAMDASLVREWTLSLGRRNARTRLLHMICEIAVRQEHAGLGNRRKVTLPLTQEQLGDALGLTAVHVNRVIQSLRDEAVIEREGRTIRIRDWAHLTREADFEDSYMRTRHGLA